MTDPLTWSPIYLGRWAGTQVRVHFSLAFYLVVELLGAALAKDYPVAQTACWLLLLLLALAVHEFGHAAVAAWLGFERDEVRLWPLGNMVSPAVASRSADHYNWMVALAGPMLNAAIFLITVVGLSLFANARFVLLPFTTEQNPYGAPFIGDKPAAFLTPVWFIGTFGFLNLVLFAANLIPALPFDTGRLVRSLLANSSVPQSKDGLLGVYTARTSAAVLAIGGVVRLIFYRNFDGLTLIFLAVLIEWMVRSEAQMLEDGGFYEDGIFGYDFSEGYTSLEGSAAKVRPYRESALKRWRRRRSDLRRQRRQAREAAEERRMDEILEKLHREGRSALSDEEHRFLVRVSAKYRNRPKAHD